MSIVQRSGRWTLDEKVDGVFVVKKGGQFEAKIVTNSYDPDADDGDETSGVLRSVIEVEDEQEAEDEFVSYVTQQGVAGFDVAR
ncbi:hypothetical protein [Halospeciosus flavus]|uniref:Uncharacterized protein n=1 Tax=Halospeciosus flavus TaxID=3032283 RepID=A0ABD5Z322_9EURY|nr:hypothetical protein [Halospeciosus flavus]